MSKDIRSYFSKANGSSVNSSQFHSPKTNKRSRRVIDSDDEDDFIPNQSSKKQKELEIAGKSKSQGKKPEVVVQVEDFFGNTPVLQKKQAVTLKNNKGASDGNKTSEKKPVKKEKNKSGDKKKKTEGKKDEALMFECDDELEASFLQTSDEHLIPNLPSVTKKTISGKLEVVENFKNGEKLSIDQNKAGTNSSLGSIVKNKTPEKDLTKEKKHNKTPDSKFENSSIINSDQKRKNAEAYQKYLHRSGPKNPGSKDIPEGTPTCLQGLTFVITGVLDSLEREEAMEMIQKCGGRVTSQVSKKTDFVIIGEEPGASKLDKAEKFGTKKINEDDLLNMIREKSGKKEVKEDSCIEGTPKKTSKYFNENGKRKHTKNFEEVKNDPSEPSSKIFKKEERKKVVEDEAMVKPNKKSPSKTKSDLLQPVEKAENKSKEIKNTADDLLWVDKYRPKSTKNILGQAGDKSNVKKLMKWLQNWHKFHSNKKEKKSNRPAPWNQNDDGSYYKAALLSGPPGVGKTTSIHLVCEELGLDIVEFNASDTRSKRLLQDEVSELLSSKSIRGYLQGAGDCYHKHVLVMDEVDGMAGNEDRGGIQELIQLIKNTKVPIIGICNDRSHPKMRSLVNYCYDLRFQRPRLEQIKGAMKSICFKENLNISGEALEELIVSSNHDVRQVLHSLSMLASGEKSLSIEEAKRSGEQAKKPLNLSPWDVVRKVFSASEQEKMSFIDKTDLFFQDYSLGPLFVQDSYLRVKPYKARNCEKKKLELISKAAESLAIGDVIEKTIRSQNAWSLLPVQAVFSSVLPGHYMSGHVQGQIQFPVWLGKNSKRNKFDRLLQELHSSLRLSITGTKESINLDYLNQLKDVIVRPLKNKGLQGVDETLKFMLEYNLTREDLDHILELSTWPGMKDSFSEVDSKVKAALTRALNKECQRVSHIAKTKTKIKGNDEVDGDDEEDDNDDDDSDDNIDLDPMIKKGKPKKVKEDVTNKSSQTKKQTSKKEKPKGKH